MAKPIFGEMSPARTELIDRQEEMMGLKPQPTKADVQAQNCKDLKALEEAQKYLGKAKNLPALPKYCAATKLMSGNATKVLGATSNIPAAATTSTSGGFVSKFQMGESVSFSYTHKLPYTDDYGHTRYNEYLVKGEGTIRGFDPQNGKYKIEKSDDGKIEIKQWARYKLNVIPSQWVSISLDDPAHTFFKDHTNSIEGAYLTSIKKTE